MYIRDDGSPFVNQKHDREGYIYIYITSSQLVMEYPLKCVTLKSWEPQKERNNDDRDEDIRYNAKYNTQET